jgi:hypothetical protein
MANKLLLDKARAHLGAALSQVLPSDDQIIVEHMRAAYELLDLHDQIEREARHA